ncbi:MAG: GIY-YIG nuclease family protein [Bacteroidales bacterium]|nr:GIY-YIG nuclease family protein [Bacteroidales bacterium]
MSTTSIISMQDLLKGRGRNTEFDQANPKRIKLVRHSGDVKQDSIIYEEYNGSVDELYYTNFKLFQKWQCEQKESNMNNVEYIVAFLAEEHFECRFIGVFKNCGKLHQTTPEAALYDLKEVDGFEILKDMVVIDWGAGTKNWMHNWTTIKEVVRIEQTSRTDGLPFFTRYEDVILSYEQLKAVVEDNDWKSKLSCLNCVYVILDKKNGKQYVGVTYKDINPGKKNGILCRWTEYAKSGHGNDKKLVELLEKEGSIYAEKNFQWSILETLPLNVTPKVAIDREKLYKIKLGTREHGYNEN